MTRAFDFTVMAVIYIVAAVVHMMGIELLAPGTPLYEMATTGTATMNGQARADLWFQMISVWVPLMGVGGITAWGMVREYRRQSATAVQGVQRV